MAEISKKTAEWGDERVVQVGWNATHMGHYLKPDRRVEVETDEHGAMRVRWPGDGKPVPITDFLERLTSDGGPSRLCRVWLITDAGKQHCCWYYGGGYNAPATGVDNAMVEHFAQNARRAALTPPAAATGSPLP